MNKDLIRSRFEKNIISYNKNAKVQNQMAEKLVSMLDKSVYEEVLEIGCGTGLLTEKAINKIQYKNYTANDIVPTCENYIKLYYIFYIRLCLHKFHKKYLR